MAASQYSENLFTAIDTIVKARMDELAYDKTVVCAIADITDRIRGKYLVTDGSSIFTAYSKYLEYELDQEVQVLVPGDASAQRTILGAYVNEKEPTSIYKTSSLSDIINISGNIIENVTTQIGLLANSPYKEEVLIWSMDCGNQAQAYTRIGLSAEFKSIIEGFDVREGDYGLRITLKGTDKTGNTNCIRDLFLSTEDMFGNIYNSENYYKQEKAFEIPKDFASLSRIELYFYQKKDTFKDADGNLIPYTDSVVIGDDSLLPNNLFVRDPFMFLGYAKEDFPEGGAFIYTFSPLDYKKDENIKKTLMLRWLLKTKNGVQLIDESNLNHETQQIIWYRYKQEDGIRDDLAGNFWEKQIINSFEYEFTANEKVQEERIKVLIKNGGAIVESNELVFTNSNRIPDESTIDAIKGLKIVCTDDLCGIFRLYGEDGLLVNSAEDNKLRILKAEYNLLDSGIENKFKDADSITWLIPKVNTMIQAPLAGQDYEVRDNITLEEDSQYYRITKIRVDGDLDLKQYYRIKPYYTPYCHNNTVKCIVARGQVTYTAEKELIFGQAGTFGTDYSLILSFENGLTAIEPNDSGVRVNANLYNANNEEIKISPTWDWLVSDSKRVISIIADNENSYCVLVPEKRKSFQDLTAVAHILRATVNEKINFGNGVQKTIKLEAFLPIPITINRDKYNRLEGPVVVNYDYNGSRCSYFKAPYALYNVKGEVVEENIDWNMHVGDDALTYYPTIENATLKPINMYVTGQSHDVAVVANDKWFQPILIQQYRYPSATMNKWDGSLTIDEENGTILSSIVGAGSKGADNSFTGVLMGEVRTAEYGDKIGLYGFQSGAQSFGFKADGTAFIGRSGHGRIEFDGTKGIISNVGNTTIFDLDDGYLQINNNGKERVLISDGVIRDTATPYFKITANNNTELIHISDNNYYLQSQDFNTENKTGTKFSLNDGTITSYKFNLITNNLSLKEDGSFNLNAIKDGSGISISSDGTNTPYLLIQNSSKDLFRISKTDLFLQTSNFSNSQKTGMKLDLLGGTIHAYDNFVLEATGSIGRVVLNPNAGVYGIEIFDQNNYGVHLSTGGILVGVGGQSFSEAPILLGTNGVMHINNSAGNAGGAIIINGTTLEDYIKSLIPKIPAIPDVSNFVTAEQMRAQINNHNHAVEVRGTVPIHTPTLPTDVNSTGKTTNVYMW